MHVTCIFFALFAIVVNPTNCARILGLFAFNGKSHSIMINAIVRELITKGHQLDVVTAFPLPSNTPNYTAFDISPGIDVDQEVTNVLNLPAFDLHDMSFWYTKEMLRHIGVLSTEYALRHPNVQQLLLDEMNADHYDLILVEQFFQDAFLMFGQKFKAPIVSISTFGWNTYFDYMLGSFGAWAHIPHELLVVPDEMSFWQRMQNVYYCLYDKYARFYVYMPQQQELANKYFAHLTGPHPPLAELTRSVAMIIQNAHTPMVYVKPNVPGIVDVGGLHITAPKRLPTDLQTFLDEAQHGAIYFSFGTEMDCSTMPEAQLSAFLQVFNEFSNIKVLWKWDSDAVEQMPNNVLTKKWLPQNDILAHPNVKLFITHGGLLGSQEGVQHGVPMLGIPFYADQHQNTERAALGGYGLKLQFNNVTVESLRWALTELLHNPVYATKIKRFSRIFRDRPESPMSRALYWIEYVIRYGGADHLRSVGGNLPWYSYFLLDIVATVAVAIWLLLMVAWYTARRILGGSGTSVEFTRKYSHKKEK